LPSGVYIVKGTDLNNVSVIKKLVKKWSNKQVLYSCWINSTFLIGWINRLW
jgi:hypothetical protein